MPRQAMWSSGSLPEHGRILSLRLSRRLLSDSRRHLLFRYQRMCGEQRWVRSDLHQRQRKVGQERLYVVKKSWVPLSVWNWQKWGVKPVQRWMVGWLDTHCSSNMAGCPLEVCTFCPLRYISSVPATWHYASWELLVREVIVSVSWHNVLEVVYP